MSLFPAFVPSKFFGHFLLAIVCHSDIVMLSNGHML